MRFLHGRLADMLFWDVVFYLLAVRGRKNAASDCVVDTDYNELKSLTGLTSKTLRKQLDLAVGLEDPYRLAVEEGIKPFSYRLILTCYESPLSERVVHKPRVFVSNHWLSVLGHPYPGRTKVSRFPLAIVNFLLRRPRGKSTSIDELMERCKKTSRSAPPDKALVNQALNHLITLGLVRRANETSFILIRDQFAVDGQLVWEQVLREQEKAYEPEILTWARNQDTTRALAAEEIARLGQFDIDTYFQQIYDSLYGIQLSTDLDLLKYAAYRHRHRPHSARRWHDCWRLFANKLAQRSVSVQSEKHHFDMKETLHRATLKMDNAKRGTLRWAKLVVWVNDKRFAATGFGRPETINVSLYDEQGKLWAREVTYEDTVIRRDLTPVFQMTDNPDLLLVVSSEQPLRQFEVEARVEAEYVEDDTEQQG